MVAGVETAVEIDRSPLHLQLLGLLTISRDGVPLDLPASRKARALVAYLSLAVRAVSRRQLCELLWDVPNDPRGELRWCLSKVRCIVDEPSRRRVDTSGDTIKLDLADCFVDAIEIARASEDGLSTLPPGRLRSLSTLFGGEFLDGLELDRNPGFNAWLTAQRRRFRGCHAVLLERLATTATGDEVFEHLEKWLELAPFDVRVHEALLNAFARRSQIREGEEHLATAGRLFEGEGLDCAPIRDRWRAAGACAVAPVPSPSPAADGDGTAASASTKATIAILPFANLSGDPAHEYLSDGITEDIITDLSRWRMLAVVSRSASFRYRGIGADVGRIARELQVRYIVEGSVRRLGERIRITAQLIDTETGSHVWADRFDRERADVFKVEDEVVQTIVSTLVGRVQAADAQRARRKPPASLAAYECVLQGNALPRDGEGAAEARRPVREGHRDRPWLRLRPCAAGRQAPRMVQRSRQFGRRGSTSPIGWRSGRWTSPTTRAPASPSSVSVRSAPLLQPRAAACGGRSRLTRRTSGTPPTWETCFVMSAGPRRRSPGSSGPGRSIPISTRPGTGTAWAGRT